jgi:hypothetical protein
MTSPPVVFILSGTQKGPSPMSSTSGPAAEPEQFEERVSIAISGVALELLLKSMGTVNASSETAFQSTVAINTYALYQARTTLQNDLELAANTLLIANISGLLGPAQGRSVSL